MTDLGESCDGIHDEDAPTHYLCTQRFPDLIDQALGDRALGGDPQGSGDDDYADVYRDEPQETE